MYKRTLVILLLVSGCRLYSQNTDIELLRSVNSQEAMRSDGFFRIISDADVYLVIGAPTVIAAAGLISHDRTALRNACVIMASTVMNVAVTNASGGPLSF